MRKSNGMLTPFALAAGGVAVSMLTLVAIYGNWAKIQGSAIEKSSPETSVNPVQSAPSVIAAMAPPAVTTQPSENSNVTASDACAKIRAVPERLICSNPELAKADVKLSQLYTQVNNLAADKESLRKDQNYWLQHTRNACSTAKCMLWAYTFRSLELQQKKATSVEKQDAEIGSPITQN